MGKSYRFPEMVSMHMSTYNLDSIGLTDLKPLKCYRGSTFWVYTGKGFKLLDSHGISREDVAQHSTDPKDKFRAYIGRLEEKEVCVLHHIPSGTVWIFGKDTNPVTCLESEILEAENFQERHIENAAPVPVTPVPVTPVPVTPVPPIVNVTEKLGLLPQGVKISHCNLDIETLEVKFRLKCQNTLQMVELTQLVSRWLEN